ncbi:hypothetical protein SALWKB12_0042 [Snodgrassella communis]|uniref:Uncharacterized protein n=1 Tax=Snodgrassella communis TaxID=2946699 RepID=A0A836Z5L6_9NEIS|nr:hypothetical protein SALWKB12_0042 [Snodgrassella communis]KDN14424.1 hypothetical protein SALWKB29_1513 [Snodgrassella communis]
MLMLWFPLTVNINPDERLIAVCLGSHWCNISWHDDGK